MGKKMLSILVIVALLSQFIVSYVYADVMPTNVPDEELIRTKISERTVPVDEEYTEGDKAIVPSVVPTKEGAEFVEWQLDGVKYDFSKPVTKAITLKAKWNDTN